MSDNIIKETNYIYILMWMHKLEHLLHSEFDQNG